ncbi:MAG: amino acid deaminase [Alphaproteobacteria bacterium]|jgi:D-serine dehydratase|nr:amino acid deaminase [Alphaproteobacteria bacterium]
MPDLSQIDDIILDGATKGVPPGAEPFPLAEIGAKGWNLLQGDLPLPLAVLKDSALRHNSDWMRRFLELSGAKLSPHGKTSMSPQLFARQIEDGAWAITVATAQQIEICRRFGFDRVILANQLVGRPAIDYVLAELARDPSFDFYCLVDSTAGVDLLARAAREAAVGRPLQVLLEGGTAGGRTGCRTAEEALAVAHAVAAAAPHLALRGVEGFEGLIPGETTAAQDRSVGTFLDFLVEIARAVDRLGLFADGPILLTAGGSAFYDLVVERFQSAGLAGEVAVMTRSGCYLTHDSGLYQRFFERLSDRTAVADLGDGPRAAFEVWAYVQSRPEPGKAILTMGRRDAGTDAEWPRPLRWFRPGLHDGPVDAPEGSAVVDMNDQHTHMTVAEDAPYQVGDMVAFGISHPCTTFDKWDLIPLVDDAYTVVSAVKTYF